MRSAFLDTSIFLLAAGGPHQDRSTCRTFIADASRKGVQLNLSIEAVQEFIFHRMRREDRASALPAARMLADSCITHPFDDAVLQQAFHLIETTSIRGRDAIHAATALIAGFDTIVSLDSDFDGLPGLRRLDPTKGDLLAR